MTSFQNFLIRIAIATLCVAFNNGCSDSDLLHESEKPLVIAVVGDGVPPIDRVADRRFPLNRAQGRLMYEGVKCALSSSRLKRLRPLIQLVTRDDAGDPRRAARIARELRRNPRVIAVIGHATSETTAAAASIYSAAGIPLLMPIATSPNVMFANGDSDHRHRRLPTVFRLPPADHIAQAPAAGWLVTQHLKAKRVALIQDTTPGATGYSVPLASAIKRYLSAIVSVEQFANRSTPNLNDLITSITADEPDLILFCGYGSTAAPIMEALRQAYASVPETSRPKIVLTDGCLGADLNPNGFSVYVLFPHAELRQAYSQDDRDDLDSIRQVFAAETGPHYGLFGFDAMLVVGQAILECPHSRIDRFRVSRELNAGKTFIGSAGIYDFRNGENSKSAYDVYESQPARNNGQFTPTITIRAEMLESMRQNGESR